MAMVPTSQYQCDFGPARCGVPHVVALPIHGGLLHMSNITSELSTPVHSQEVYRTYVAFCKIYLLMLAVTANILRSLKVI